MKNKPCSEIKKEFDGADEENFLRLRSIYEADPRKSVQDIIKRAEKRLEREAAEIRRLYDMHAFEREYPGKYICGIDEVGRGPLAGPVSACAVIMKNDSMIPGINDSKKLSESMREKLYDEIVKDAVCFHVASVDNEEIDRINILNATKKAMTEAVNSLSVKPDVLLIDAVHLPETDILQRSIIKGDAKSYSIACASILAKVTRDRMMKEYDRKYPEYGFSENKGYGTRKHTEAIERFGPCPIHRRTFIGKFTGNT